MLVNYMFFRVRFWFGFGVVINELYNICMYFIGGIVVFDMVLIESYKIF